MRKRLAINEKTQLPEHWISDAIEIGNPEWIQKFADAGVNISAKMVQHGLEKYLEFHDGSKFNALLDVIKKNFPDSIPNRLIQHVLATPPASGCRRTPSTLIRRLSMLLQFMRSSESLEDFEKHAEALVVKTVRDICLSLEKQSCSVEMENFPDLAQKQLLDVINQVEKIDLDRRVFNLLQKCLQTVVFKTKSPFQNAQISSELEYLRENLRFPTKLALIKYSLSELNALGIHTSEEKLALLKSAVNAIFATPGFGYVSALSEKQFKNLFPTSELLTLLISENYVIKSKSEAQLFALWMLKTVPPGSFASEIDRVEKNLISESIWKNQKRSYTNPELEPKSFKELCEQLSLLSLKLTHAYSRRSPDGQSSRIHVDFNLTASPEFVHESQLKSISAVYGLFEFTDSFVAEVYAHLLATAIRRTTSESGVYSESSAETRKKLNSTMYVQFTNTMQLLQHSESSQTGRLFHLFQRMKPSEEDEQFFREIQSSQQNLQINLDDLEHTTNISELMAVYSNTTIKALKSKLELDNQTVPFAQVLQATKTLFRLAECHKVMIESEIAQNLSIAEVITLRKASEKRQKHLKL